MNNCPHCNANLIGEEIPKEQQRFFGTAHWHREIGIEYPEKYDGVWEYQCPDCGGTWPSEVAKLRGNYEKK